MKRSHSHTGVLFLLLGLIHCSNAFGREITVDQNGAVTSLTAALVQANDGDRIRILPGSYREGNILVDKTVHIFGEGFPVFDGEDKGEVITVTANNVIIEGLLIRGSGLSYVDDNAGIKLVKVENCVIRKNRFEDNFFGLYLSQVRDCLVEDNDFTASGTRETASGNGIHLWYCKDVTVRNNTIRGHRDGIYFEFVRNGKISGNVSEHNLRYGLHFMFSDSCSYKQNVFRDNGAGVAVMYTKYVDMSENLFEHNWGAASFGILLKDITDSRIHHNVFVRNTIGLYSEGSTRLVVERNDFIQNGWALKIMANSMEGTFTANNFVGNSFDVATNSRQNFNTFTGNYWDNYTGYDLDRNGIGDVPFRPVTLFSLITQQQEPALILLRSFFIDVLNLAEKMIPVLTPVHLMDENPSMRRIL